MPSQDKLIKQGILLTDNLFDEIAKRLSRGVKASDTLEAFLNQTKDYTTNNPLVLNGYKDKMLELILQETNNHKFSRPAQRELTRATIEKRVGDRIVDVGEDIVQSVRDIVKWGYNNNKSQDEIADEITHRVDVIKNTRARTIARTEVARTASASDYVINKERGATHFTVDCRDTCCPVCRKDYNFGNVEYTIDQVEMLPPRHPNCRCYARYSIKGGSGVKASKKPYPAQSSTGAREPTKEQLSNNLTAMERSKYANYKRLVDSHTKWLNDNPDAPAKQIDNHKKKLAAALVKLNELKAKALGGSVPASKPKTTSKPKETPKQESSSKEPVPLKLNGDYTEYTETLKDGSKLKVYEFKNGFTLGIAEGSPVTHEQVINHISSLPDELINQIKLKRINLYLDETTKGGYSDILKNIMLQYSSNESVSTILDNLTHELSHAFDYQQVEEINHAGLSLREVYDKIFIADNKLGQKYVNPETGEVFYRERFPTDYAKTSYHAFKKMHQEDMEAWNNRTRDVPKPHDKRYSEDFAESSRLYLNPATHDKFVKEFPNRAKFLEGYYGKFKVNKNAPLYKALVNEGVLKESAPKPPAETKTPTREQLDKNLSQKERKEYKDIEYEIKWANDILNKASSTDKQKSYAQTRLDAITPRFKELSDKALGVAPKRTRKSSKTKRKTKKTKEPVQLDKPKNARLTKEECDSLTFEQLAEHHDASYKGLVKIASDNNKEYHVFEQTFDNGETFKLHFEKGAVNSYNKEGIASANEIIHEALKVPEVLRKETNEIWFRNTQKTSAENKKGTGFRSFQGNEGGVNTSTNKRWYEMMKRMGKDVLNDPNHRIAINPKYFKKLTSFGDIINWRNRPQNTTLWKHAVHHEFTHSIDTSRDIWKNDKTRLSSRKEYLEIERAEPDFTVYAHEQISEAYAEHGGYISYMLANPEEQSKKIQILTFERDEKGRRKGRPVQEEIDFEEYKRRFPKHYKYFTKLFKEGVKE